MNSLLYNATALKDLEVSVTNTRISYPSHNMTIDWFKLTAIEREAAVTKKDKRACVAYVNN